MVTESQLGDKGSNKKEGRMEKGGTKSDGGREVVLVNHEREVVELHRLVEAVLTLQTTTYQQEYYIQ